MKKKIILILLCLIFTNCSDKNVKIYVDTICKNPELLYKYYKDTNIVSKSFRILYVNPPNSYLLDTIVKSITLLFSKGYKVESAKRIVSSDVNNKKTQWYEVRIVNSDNQFMDIIFVKKSKKWLINAIRFSERQFDAFE